MSALASCVFFRVREVLVLSPRGRKGGEERVGGESRKIPDNGVRFKVSCIAKITQKEEKTLSQIFWSLGKIYVKL